MSKKDALRALFAELNASEIAEQLTLMDGAIFVRIQEHELQNLNWTRAEKEYTAPNGSFAFPF